MTDKEQREQEKLKTPEDYILAIKTVSSAICNAKKADKKVDDILLMLAEALYDKYKYIISLSKPYRKKQSVWSKISDYFAIRREMKGKDQQTHAENEQYDDVDEVEEEEPSDEEVTSSPASQILQLEKRVEVLENKSAEESADDDVLDF